VTGGPARLACPCQRGLAGRRAGGRRFSGTIELRTGGFASVTEQDWAATLAVNFLAAVASAAVAGTPTGRVTQPGEVADLVLFLASPRAGNITGADFAIDGGLKTTL
jgi:NAD(P)-dependent dehydrogenase (short-subunit alcohol dehydrogenase family)